jgi:hypothetical protein
VLSTYLPRACAPLPNPSPENVDQCPYCGNTYVHECPKCGLLVCSADQAPQRCLGCSEWGISPPLTDPTIPAAAQPPRFTLGQRYYSVIGYLSDSLLDWQRSGAWHGRPVMGAGRLRQQLSRQVENARTWWLKRQANRWR